MSSVEVPQMPGGYPLHPREAERLDLLHSLEILEAVEDNDAFDNITQLAASMFNVPIALVPLIDTDRHWFKAHTGMPMKEMTRKDTFCNYTIMPDAGPMLVVLDAKKDARYNKSMFVTGPPFLSFYAGVPIILDGTNQLPIGTLCIADSKPREEFTEDERKNLQRLAGIVKTMIEKLLSRREASRKARERIFSKLCHEVLNPLHIIQHLALRMETEAPSQGVAGVKRKLEDVTVARRKSEALSLSTIKETILFESEKVVTLLQELNDMYSDTSHQGDLACLEAVLKQPRNPRVVNICRYMRDAVNSYALLAGSKYSVKKRLANLPDVTLVFDVKLLGLFMNHIFTLASRVVQGKQGSKKELTVTAQLNNSRTSLKVAFEIPLVKTLCYSGCLSLPELGEAMPKSITLGKTFLGENALSVWVSIDTKVVETENPKQLIDVDSSQKKDCKKPVESLEDCIVLACEDESAARMILQNILVRGGIKRENILMLCDGDEVEPFLQMRKDKGLRMPDIGLFDVVMQRMNGDDCLTSLRKQGFSFPVLATTACDYNEELIAKGFSRVVNKPYTTTDIHFAMNEVMLGLN